MLRATSDAPGEWMCGDSKIRDGCVRCTTERVIVPEFVVSTLKPARRAS